MNPKPIWEAWVRGVYVNPYIVDEEVLAEISPYVLRGVYFQMYPS